MLGDVKHKKGRFSNDVGLRKTQEGKDFQANFPEVETSKTREGKDDLPHATGWPDELDVESRPAGRSQGTVHMLSGWRS